MIQQKHSFSLYMLTTMEDVTAVFYNATNSLLDLDQSPKDPLQVISVNTETIRLSSLVGSRSMGDSVCRSQENGFGCNTKVL